MGIAKKRSHNGWRVMCKNKENECGVVSNAKNAVDSSKRWILKQLIKPIKI